MSNALLRASLLRLKRRLVLVRLSTGAGWGLVVGMAVLVGCMWVDLALHLPSGLRVSSSGLALAACVLLILWAVRSAAHNVAVLRLARRLDRAASARGQIVSGVDLAATRIHASVLTAGLAELAIGRAADLSASVSPARAVPSRPVRMAFGMAVGVCIAIACLAILAPRMAATQWRRFADPYGDHPPYSSVVLRVEPGDARVVYGEGLDVFVTAEGTAVERVDLVLESGEEETLPMFPEPGGRWRASIANVTTPQRYFARAHTARSHKYTIDVITVPRIEEVRFRVIPPAYTHLAPQDGPLPPGGLAGLPGTRVEVAVRSNRPLASGSMTITGENGDVDEALTPAEDGDREVRGAFEIASSGKIALRVKDVDGETSRQAYVIPVSLLADGRPFVRLLEPQPLSFATPDVVLPVAISAEDDYGVSRLLLYRSLNESRALPMTVAMPAPPLTRVDERVAMPLSSYGLQPGDVIKLFARVEDNDPAGAKGSESDIVTVRIISKADYQRMVLARQGMEVLQSKYREAQRRLERLAAEMEQLRDELAGEPEDGEVSEEMRRRLERLSKRMAREAREIADLAENDLPFDLDKALREQLDKLAKSLRQSAEAAGRLARQAELTGRQARDQLEALRKKLAGDKREYERQAIEPLEYLAKIFPLKQDEARFVKLYQRQRSLAERMASLVGRDGEDDPSLKARMRDLESEQREIREALTNLLEDIEADVAQLPDDESLDELRETATAFVKAVRESEADKEMERSEAGLAEFSGTAAHTAAESAADILERFISKCQGMGQQAMQCLPKFGPNLGECLSNTAAQLLAAMGMNSGMGMGQGIGGGYSVSQNTMQNVGIYGNLPTRGNQTRRGSADRGGGIGLSGGDGGGNDSSSVWSARQSGMPALGGGADAAVPASYRRRVGEYFRRVADELGSRDEGGRRPIEPRASGRD